MNDYDKTDQQVGGFIDIIFIIALIVIGYMAVSSSGEKTEYLTIALIAYLIKKTIKDSISKI